jgi:hypothetical protein
MEKTLLNMDYKFGYALVLCDSINNNRIMYNYSMTFMDEISINMPKVIKWMKFSTFG